MMIITQNILTPYLVGVIFALNNFLQQRLRPFQATDIFADLHAYSKIYYERIICFPPSQVSDK